MTQPNMQQLLKKMTQLSRLAITPEESFKIEEDLTKFLKYIDILNQVDITNVEPTAHASEIQRPVREDIASEKELQNAILNNAPALVEDQLIKVPAVLPTEEMGS